MFGTHGSGCAFESSRSGTRAQAITYTHTHTHTHTRRTMRGVLPLAKGTCWLRVGLGPQPHLVARGRGARVGHNTRGGHTQAGMKTCASVCMCVRVGAGKRVRCARVCECFSRGVPGTPTWPVADFLSLANAPSGLTSSTSTAASFASHTPLNCRGKGTRTRGTQALQVRNSLNTREQRKSLRSSAGRAKQQAPVQAAPQTPRRSA